jgi:hypothetical protein
LCEIAGRNGFHYLRVPSEFFAKNRKELCVISKGAKDYFRLHLSDRDRDRFVDLRGGGRVGFAEWVFRA